MAAPTLATVAELSEWLGEQIGGSTPEQVADQKRAEWALRMASALVRAESGRSWLDGNGGLLPQIPDQVQLVTLAAAARAYSNPDGGSVVSESIDDYQYREAEQQEAGVYLTASERALLAPFAGGALAGIGTISTTRGDYDAPDDLSWIRNGPDPMNPW